MRKNYLLTFILLFTISFYAQVGIGTTTPEGALDIVSTDSGLLVPRVSLTNLSTAAPVTNPQGGGIAESTLIYHDGSNSITAGFYYWNGSAWTPFGGADADWTISGNDMYNANSGNVGVGNTSPSAKFHITGTTSPGGGGGTVTLLNENFTGYTVSQNYVSDSDCTTTDGWIRSGSGDSNVNCSACAGDRLYITSDDSGCIQDATAIVALSSNPTTTSINISFDYRYNNFGASGDSFRAYLYNETTATQAGADLLNLTADADTSFSGSATVVTGNSYSLRFEYNGNFDYGVTVDNVLVQETTTGGSGTYMFRLEDGQQQDGYVLTSDANGNATWEAAAGVGGTDDQVIDQFTLSGTTLSISLEDDGVAPLTVDLSGLGGGGSYTFESGITESAGSVVRLGGALTQDTTIDIGDNDFTINGNSTLGFTGEMTLNGNNRIIFETEVDEDYINFGGSAFVDADDGDGFSDTFGTAYTKDFVWGAHNGSSGGTGIALGSIEYVVDGTDELFYEGSAFSPMTDVSADLGADPFTGTPRRWDDVYADDFTNITPFAPDDSNPTESGFKSLNKNDYSITKGLNEIMKLKPITYIGGAEYMNGKKLSKNQRDVKLGFFTSDLLEVIPEAVKTEDWAALDESGKKTRVRKDKPTGVMYNQIIPVTVKAIQEQQTQIDQLKETVELLKKQNQQLMKLLDKK